MRSTVTCPRCKLRHELSARPGRLALWAVCPRCHHGATYPLLSERTVTCPICGYTWRTEHPDTWRRCPVCAADLDCESVYHQLPSMPRDAPYRRPAHRCELCDRETGADGLTRYAALGLCQACIGGELEPALGRWGLTLEPDAVVWTGRLDLELRLTRERFGHRLRKVLGLGDPEVGDPSFDDEVWVDGEPGRQARRLLAEEGVREAISRALESAREVVLSLGRVTAPSATEERLPLVALAVHVTRLAKQLRAQSSRAPRNRDPRVPFGRKVCRSCGEVAFDRVARCPACRAEAWWT